MNQFSRTELAFPFLLWAQTDWNKPLYQSSESATIETPAEEEAAQEDVAPTAVRLGDPSPDFRAGTGPQVQNDDGLVFIDGFDKSGFLSGLTNSRTYFIKGDTATFNDVEALIDLAGATKAKSELSSAKNWSIAAIVFAVATVTGVCVGAWGSDDIKAYGLTFGLASFGAEIFSARQANNHYNDAIEIYNERLRNGDFDGERPRW